MGSAASNIVSLSLPGIIAREDIQSGAQLVGGSMNAFLPPADPSLEDIQSAANLVSGSFTEIDPSFAEVSLLLHMDGSNGSTAFPDSSSNAFTMTRTGTPIVDTSAPEFGSGAMRVSTTPGFNAIHTAITAAGPLDMQAEDFTAEGWLKLDSGAISCLLLASNTTSAIHGGLEVTATIGGTMSIGISVVIAGVEYTVGTAAITATPGVWYSWAAVRQGTTLLAFLNGVASTPGACPAGAITSDTTMLVGGGVGGLGFSIIGELDEVRLTKGIARYLANYTPSGPFPNS